MASGNAPFGLTDSKVFLANPQPCDCNIFIKLLMNVGRIQTCYHQQPLVDFPRPQSTPLPKYRSELIILQRSKRHCPLVKEFSFNNLTNGPDFPKVLRDQHHKFNPLMDPLFESDTSKCQLPLNGINTVLTYLFPQYDYVPAKNRRVKERYIPDLSKALDLQCARYPNFHTMGFGHIPAPSEDIFFAALGTAMEFSPKAMTAKLSLLQFDRCLKLVAARRLHHRSSLPFLSSPDRPRRILQVYRNASKIINTEKVSSRNVVYEM